MDEVTTRLVLHCCECGSGVDVPEEQLVFTTLPRFLIDRGWYVSVITPPGEPAVRMALLCSDCAGKALPKQIREAAKREILAKPPPTPDQARRKAVEILKERGSQVFSKEAGGFALLIVLPQFDELKSGTQFEEVVLALRDELQCAADLFTKALPLAS